MLRSSKNADQRKQWWYRVAGYSAVAPSRCLVLSLFQLQTSRTQTTTTCLNRRFHPSYSLLYLAEKPL